MIVDRLSILLRSAWVTRCSSRSSDTLGDKDMSLETGSGKIAGGGKIF